MKQQTLQSQPSQGTGQVTRDALDPLQKYIITPQLSYIIASAFHTAQRSKAHTPYCSKKYPCQPGVINHFPGPALSKRRHFVARPTNTKWPTHALH